MALTQDVKMVRAEGAFGAYAAACVQSNAPGELGVEEMVSVNSHFRSIKTNRFPWIKMSRCKWLSPFGPTLAIASRAW